MLISPYITLLIGIAVYGNLGDCVHPVVISHSESNRIIATKEALLHTLNICRLELSVLVSDLAVIAVVIGICKASILVDAHSQILVTLSRDDYLIDILGESLISEFDSAIRYCQRVACIVIYITTLIGLTIYSNLSDRFHPVIIAHSKDQRVIAKEVFLCALYNCRCKLINLAVLIDNRAVLLNFQDQILVTLSGDLNLIDVLRKFCTAKRNSAIGYRQRILCIIVYKTCLISLTIYSDLGDCIHPVVISHSEDQSVVATQPALLNLLNLCRLKVLSVDVAVVKLHIEGNLLCLIVLCIDL